MGQKNLGWKIEKERLEKDIGSLGKSIIRKDLYKHNHRIQIMQA